MNRENNKIIAKFMGYELTTDGIQTLYYDKDRNLKALPKYDKDWNWLMEVVEKIEDLGFEIEINGLSCRILTPNKQIETSGKTKIKGVYNGCVEFIKWYN